MKNQQQWFTKQFIKEIITSINVPKNEFKNISISLDTSNLNPGKYADYVTVKTGERSEKLTIELELLEPEERYPGQFKALSEQQPSTIATTNSSASQIEAEKNQAKLLKIILLVALGLVLMGGVVFLHIRSKSKTIRY